jgi:hypothetical protein
VVSGCGVVGWGKQTDMLHRARSEKSGESIEQLGQCRSVQCSAVQWRSGAGDTEGVWRSEEAAHYNTSHLSSVIWGDQITSIVRDRIIRIELYTRIIYTLNRMKCQKSEKSLLSQQGRGSRLIFFVAEVKRANWRVCCSCCVFCSPL